MSWKNTAVLIPIILLIFSVFVAQVYQTGRLPGRLGNIEQISITEPQTRWERILLAVKDWILHFHKGGLELLGYNFNRDMAQLSLTVLNRGSQAIMVDAVVYDDIQFTKGLIRSDHTSTNDIIFAPLEHWNMDSSSSATPTISPNSVAIFYLGTPLSQAATTHQLKIVTEVQVYTFLLTTHADR